MSNTYFCEYAILPQQQTRDACMTLFGGMTKNDDQKELGCVKLLGRWSCVGEARGFCIAEAPDVESMQSWLTAWVPMADIKVVPCLDDNQHRELILGKKPEYTVQYKNVDAPPKEGESLYFIKYNFKDGVRKQGFEVFANMKQEDDQKDPGLCTSYGRWHVPSQGCGYGIASSPTVLDIYKWAYHWDELCDVVISPVTGDDITRKIIKNRPDFKQKHKLLMEQLTGGNSSGFFCHC